MKLNELHPAEGSSKNTRRVGRGQGSGKGGTSTRGTKGAGSRAGFKNKIGFEGGQMPLQRRIPKFGFVNPTRIDYSVVNVDSLQFIATEDASRLPAEIGPEQLKELGLISTLRQKVKILGRGEISVALTLHAHKFSETAKAAIEQAGGKAIVIEHIAKTA